jgi:ribonuclease HII
MFIEFSGIDEAALGPVLGPYCCAVTSFRHQKKKELFDIFSEFKNVKIADSKKLYTSGKSIRELENTALTFASLFLGSIPENSYDLISALIIDKQYLNQLKEIPWYENLIKLKLPYVCSHDALMENHRALEIFMEQESVELNNIMIDVVSAEKFNDLLDLGFNKSQVCQKIISPLVKGSLKKQSRITIDRQGGRRYYGDWLVEIFPGSPLSIERETKDLSSYRIQESFINFQVRGDDKFLETALASIFSKYVRELIMICFNEYWQKLLPGIKKTAGYPQDGKRFIQELRDHDLLQNEHKLIRQK